MRENDREFRILALDLRIFREEFRFLAGELRTVQLRFSG